MLTMGSHAVAAPIKPVPRFGRKEKIDSTADLTQGRVHNALAIAQQKGLLKGRRTLVIRGRMPEELVAEAKRKTGITSDSKLLETALANIVAADDYAEWLFSQRGTVDAGLDLEF
ncbi:MAG TPA: hypothetical protein VGF82_15505 [Terracidiphilus sp.]